jgi:hypothetical protein
LQQTTTMLSKLNIIFLSFLILVLFSPSFKAQSSTKEYPTIAAYGLFMSCWDAWLDYLIICTNDPEDIEKSIFEIWNTTSQTLIRTIPRQDGHFIAGNKDYYILGMYRSKNFTKYSVKDDSFIQTYSIPYGIYGVDSFLISDDYFYILYENPYGLAIVSQETGQVIKLIGRLAERWYFSRNSLYNFQKYGKKTYYIKLDHLGKFVWNSSIPQNCPEAMIPTENSLFVYILCIKNEFISTSSVTQLNNNDGSLIRHFALAGQNSIRIKTLEDKFLVFFVDGTIQQYTVQDAEFSTIYGKVQPLQNGYYSFRIANSFVFYNIRTAVPGGYTFRVVQQKIKEVSQKTQFTTKNDQDLKEGSLSMENIDAAPTSALNTVTFTNRYSKLNSVVWQNSYFSPVILPSTSNWTVMYFTGAGNIKRATCADYLMYNIFVSSLDDDDKTAWSYTYAYIQYDNSLSIGGLNDYASVLIFEGTPHYLIHGGKSCNTNIYNSDMFLVELSGFNNMIISQDKSSI